MFINEPTSEWSMTLNSIDLPTDYFLTFATYIASISALLLPWAIVDFVLGYLSKLALKNQDSYEFYNQKFLPELRTATKDIVISRKDKTDLIDKVFGMVMKILYAFTW